MEKIILENLIALGYSQREIAKETKLSQSNIKYWLLKFDLKTKKEKYNKNKQIEISEKYCSKCKTIKSVEDFYKRSKDSKVVSNICKSCSNENTIKRLIVIKMKMIEYKGGCCEKCNLDIKNSHYSVFEFHHLNPDEKDINFRHIKSRKWEVIKNEIDKCMLLCANCHRIIHANREMV